MAYALVLPLKWHGLMPDHMGWLGLACAPLALLGFLVWLVVSPALFPRHADTARTAGGFALCVLLMVVLLIERG